MVAPAHVGYWDRIAVDAVRTADSETETVGLAHSILDGLAGYWHRIGQIGLPLARAGSRQPGADRSYPGAEEGRSLQGHRIEEDMAAGSFDFVGFGCTGFGCSPELGILAAVDQAAGSTRLERGRSTDRKDRT